MNVSLITFNILGLPQNGAVYLNAHLNNGNSMFDLEDFGEKQTKAV